MVNVKKKYDNEFCIFCIGGNHIRCKKFTIIYRSYSVNSIKPLYTSFAFVKQKRMKKKEREMREVDQLVVEPVSILQVNSLSCGGKKKYYIPIIEYLNECGR